MVYIGNDGLPAVLIWAHCDDFLIHGPTYTKTVEALKAFLDVTVEVDMLCHPGKLPPPAQVVKYTGLLFDTVSTPTLRIPEYKCAKTLAMLEYTLQHRLRISRLGLAVVVGVLESMTEATQSRIDIRICKLCRRRHILRIGKEMTFLIFPSRSSLTLM
jgi:hypothetical protein